MTRSLKVALVGAGLVAALTVTAAQAAPPEFTAGDSFVCPVFNADSEAGQNATAQAAAGFVVIGGGGLTIITAEGPTVPVLATNDDGGGTPGGAHASPGDPGYSAIWAN